MQRSLHRADLVCIQSDAGGPSLECCGRSICSDSSCQISSIMTAWIASGLGSILVTSNHCYVRPAIGVMSVVVGALRAIWMVFSPTGNVGSTGLFPASEANNI